ncbi:unnamed protein product [Adineta steineri]|uniref:Uncharacterized protein n=1 Tax=Adineta steineri TaxID=433720 RepID=A0A819RYG5_9BILA|nr:unnamed protein product [Adineta steineri]
MSTVQLSPFVEGQWHRLDTYSPVYTNSADIPMNTQQRTHRPTSGKLNVIDSIDINTLKLDDEILLNELHDIRKGSALLSRVKNANQEQEKQAVSSNFLHESKLPLKHSVQEPSFAYQSHNNTTGVLSSNKSIPFGLNNWNEVKKFPHLNFGPKPQPALLAQLRQSAIIRQNTFVANEQRLSTPLPISTPKRSLSSAQSNRYHRQSQQSESTFRHEINSTGSNEDQLTDESLSFIRKIRLHSAQSSRSGSIHLLKTKSDRTRPKPNIDLTTVLMKPWRQATWNDDGFDNSIPNSLDLMHQICGPSTPFERNLRQDYHKQLNLYRSASTKA